uniref:Putative ovule protein n=1 Tax=Solanum chacoense TaxID=4108 RepID=A0A0V0I5Q4_SOLCH
MIPNMIYNTMHKFLIIFKTFLCKQHASIRLLLNYSLPCALRRREQGKENFYMQKEGPKEEVQDT